ncbi:MAG: FtsX-like permease family protein, partial [Bryobacteraceae bacterium]
QPLTVVGVARDSIYVDAKGAAGAHYYQPFTGGFEGLLTFLVRTQAEPLALAEGVRTAVRSLDPNLPVSNVKTMRVQMESSLWLDRLGATIVSLFGIMAALVATIGLYAVMAAFVAQRTREIGIRMALGAQARDILAKVLKRGGVLTGIGLLLGALISLGATRVLQSLLYGVTTTDVTTFSAASALLLATAVAACWIPARKASRVDPMVSLRHE